MVYSVDGNTTEKVDGYNIWRVKTNATVVCSFYGPMAFLAAAAFAKAMNTDSISMQEAIDMSDMFRTNSDKE